MQLIVVYFTHNTYLQEEMSGFLNIDDANINEYCVVVLENIDGVLETMRIEEPPIDDEIQPMQTFVETASATDFTGFETLHNIVLDIDDQLLCSNVQMEVRQMYDELRHSFETFQRNVNKLTLNVECKKSMHSRIITLHDMFKQ